MIERPAPPSVEDLTPQERAALDAAYAARRRRQCSFEDFADGYLAGRADASAFDVFLGRSRTRRPVADSTGGDA